MAEYEKLKSTFQPLTISVRGGSPILKINNEAPRQIMPGANVDTNSPADVNSPVVLEFRHFPPALSESDGNVISVNSPASTVVGNKRVSYTHNNQAIYKVEKLSAEGPNVFVEEYVDMSTAVSVSIALYNSFKNNTAVSGIRVSKVFEGIRTTITRVEEDVEAE